jgi:hypothetical protein
LQAAIMHNSNNPMDSIRFMRAKIIKKENHVWLSLNCF